MEDFTAIGQDVNASAQGPGPLSELVRVLTDTKPWLRFFAVLLFICCGLMVVGGLISIIAGLGTSIPGSMIFTLIIGLLYMAIGLLYLFPGMHLNNAANAIRDLELNSSPQAVAMPLIHQYKYWRFIGILTIVAMVLGVLFMLIAIGVGLSVMNRF